MTNAVNFFSSQTVSSILVTGAASAAVSAGILALGWKVTDSISNPNMRKIVKTAIFFFSVATPLVISKSLAVYAIVILSPQAVLLGSLVGAAATAIIMSRNPKPGITPEQIAKLKPEQISKMGKAQLQKYRDYFQKDEQGKKTWVSGLPDDTCKAFCRAFYRAFQNELELALQRGNAALLEKIIAMDEQALQRSRKFFKENDVLYKSLPRPIRIAFNIREVLASPMCETLVNSAAGEIVYMTQDQEQFRLYEEQYLISFSKIWDRLPKKICRIYKTCVSHFLTQNEISNMKKDRLQRYLDYFQQEKLGKALWNGFLTNIREQFCRAFYHAFQSELKQILPEITTTSAQIIAKDDQALPQCRKFFEEDGILYKSLPDKVRLVLDRKRRIAGSKGMGSIALDIHAMSAEEFELCEKAFFDLFQDCLPKKIAEALETKRDLISSSS